MNTHTGASSQAHVHTHTYTPAPERAEEGFGATRNKVPGGCESPNLSALQEQQVPFTTHPHLWPILKFLFPFVFYIFYVLCVWWGYTYHSACVKVTGQLSGFLCFYHVGPRESNTGDQVRSKCLYPLRQLGVPPPSLRQCLLLKSWPWWLGQTGQQVPGVLQASSPQAGFVDTCHQSQLFKSLGPYGYYRCLLVTFTSVCSQRP